MHANSLTQAAGAEGDDVCLVRAQKANAAIGPATEMLRGTEWLLTGKDAVRAWGVSIWPRYHTPTDELEE